MIVLLLLAGLGTTVAQECGENWQQFVVADANGDPILDITQVDKRVTVADGADLYLGEQNVGALLSVLKGQLEDATQQLAQLTQQLAAANADLAALKAAPSGGATYVRWGVRTCPDGSDLVAAGVISSSQYQQGGNSNHFCLPTSGAKGNRVIPRNDDRSLIYHTEFQVNSNPSFGFAGQHDTEAVCAICRAPVSDVHVFWARNDCPANYDLLYAGAAMGAKHNHGARNAICVDLGAGNMNLGIPGDQNGDLLYHVNTRKDSNDARHLFTTLTGIPDSADLVCAVCAIS